MIYRFPHLYYYNILKNSKMIVHKNNKLLYNFSLKKLKYKINRNHPLIKEILHLDNEKSLIAETLKIIEENIPIDLILYNQNEDPSFHESEKFNEIPNEQIIKIACELYNIKISQGVPIELSKQQIMSSDPFNLYPIILDYLK